MKASTLVAPKKLRSPLKWHGGKFYLARRIISLFPWHETYVEPFIGGASILLNKKRVHHEVISDLNRQLIEFWKVLATLDRPVRGHAALWHRIQLEFEPRDLWLGVFWELKERDRDPVTCEPRYFLLEFYLCLVPCLPIHVCLYKRNRNL